MYKKTGYNRKGGGVKAMILGEMIKELREDRNYTQKEFAEILNITTGCLSKYETGRTQPPIDMLIKIADTLNVTIDYLVGRNIGTVDYNMLKKHYIKSVSGFEVLNDIYSLDPRRRKLLVDVLSDFKKCTNYDKMYEKTKQ